MEEKKKNKKGLIITLLLIVFLVSVGGTYAFYSYTTTSEEGIIAGNIVGMDATVTVTLKSSAGQMVPMSDDGLATAILAENNCIDGNGNLSCQIYEITLTNQGNTIDNIKGTVELYAEDGSTYTNLKWQELSSQTTIATDSKAHAMDEIEPELVSGYTLESKASATWYIAVWISETDENQNGTDTGNYRGTVTFVTEATYPLYDTIITGAVEDKDINFAEVSSETNGEGIYMLSSTKDDMHPIYYYRGAVENNNVIFANFCWKIVRTTETGGIKLIYNGTPTDGTCDNTGTASQIGTSSFNPSYDYNAYVGYMYGTPNSSTYEAEHANTKDSTIKGVIDTWYASNMTGYTDMLEDTVFCNDRSVVSGNGYGTSGTLYGAHDRLETNKEPSLACSQQNDRFTVEVQNAEDETKETNGDLTYPVGLLTADEVAFAGAVYSDYNSSYYLYTGQDWWTTSPYYYSAGALGFQVGSIGYLSAGNGVLDDVGVRPVVSLASGTNVIGSGTVNDPYVVK